MAQKLLNTFAVGCDPEFALFDGATAIKLTADFDLTLDNVGSIGIDHGGRVIELRPKEAKGTYMLVKRIQKLLHAPQARTQIENYRWKAGALSTADWPTLGGHVHLGFQWNDAWGTKNPQHPIVKTLDRVTLWLEALDILPTEESAERRKHPKYGHLGDCRVSTPHQFAHPEYRSMASWLLSPAITYTALTTAKLAACAPEFTLDALPLNQHSWNKLVKFYHEFKGKDSNAKRWIERITQLRQIQVDPDEDFKDRWETLEALA